MSASAFVLATSLFYVSEPAVFMREEPSDSARVASQTIFAENIQVKEKRGEWCSIITPDGYEGWIRLKSIVEVDKPYEPTAKISELVALSLTVKIRNMVTSYDFPMELRYRLSMTASHGGLKSSFPTEWFAMSNEGISRQNQLFIQRPI